jgi:uncharacterized protein
LWGGASNRSANSMRGITGSSTVLGLDLAGSPARDTGCCLLSGDRSARASVLHSDDEIVRTVLDAQPVLTLIDAPLSLPRGRRTIEDRTGPHLRECDRELRRRGIPFFPLTLGPMRMLTERGMRLTGVLRAHGCRVEEGYPGGAQDILGLPRKQRGTRRLQSALHRIGVLGDVSRRALTHDELDAVTLAWVAHMYLEGGAHPIGEPDEGTMILPLGAAGRRPRGPSPRPDRPPLSPRRARSNR